MLMMNIDDNDDDDEGGGGRQRSSAHGVGRGRQKDGGIFCKK